MGIHVEPLAREPSVHMPMALSPMRGVQRGQKEPDPGHWRAAGCREQVGTYQAPQESRRAGCGRPRECLPASQPHTHRDKGPLCGQEAGAGLVPELRQHPGPSCQPCSSGAAQGGWGCRRTPRAEDSVRMGPHKAPLCWPAHSTWEALRTWGQGGHSYPQVCCRDSSPCKTFLFGD